MILSSFILIVLGSATKTLAQSEIIVKEIREMTPRTLHFTKPTEGSPLFKKFIKRIQIIIDENELDEDKKMIKTMIKHKYVLSTESITMTTTEETEPETDLEDTEADTEPQVVTTTTEEPETEPEIESEETEPDFVKTSTNKPRQFKFNDKFIQTLAADQIIQDNLV